MRVTRRRFVGSGLAAGLLTGCGGGADAPTEPSPSRTGGEAQGPVLLGEDLSARSVFPSDNWWNREIADAPVDPLSSRLLDELGRDRRLHPDFGPSPYGIPYVTVSRGQPRLAVRFVDYPEESAAGAPGRPPGYPIPDEARSQPNFIEGGEAGGGTDGDRHLIVIDRDDWLLFETWATRYASEERVWEAGSGAVFDMNRNDRRPEGFTSADAAGLAIFPGLVRHDEAFGVVEIRHAFRVTVRATDGYVWPASHEAGGTAGALPMGARLRLKVSRDLTAFPDYLQRIFRAMKRYGLIVADNGSDMYVTGTMDSGWNNDELNPAFRELRVGDFEVIELGWR